MFQTGCHQAINTVYNFTNRIHALGPAPKWEDVPAIYDLPKTLVESARPLGCGEHPSLPELKQALKDALAEGLEGVLGWKQGFDAIHAEPVLMTTPEEIEPETPAPMPKKILAIGNSFSVDAMQHLWEILNGEGYTDFVLGNLYIGGCSIDGHKARIESGAADYTPSCPQPSACVVPDGTRSPSAAFPLPFLLFRNNGKVKRNEDYNQDGGRGADT